MPAVLASAPVAQRHSVRACLLAYLPFAAFTLAWLLLPRFAKARHIALLIYMRGGHDSKPPSEKA
ncbi:MAG: hypothetical protein IT210_08615 [Armatimonadetes bacterium]|nr:hypothetical protein [Armatimonadota bacterium]